MKISDQTSISMPMRNLLSIVAAVAVGVWAYFGVIERLNKLDDEIISIDGIRVQNNKGWFLKDTVYSRPFISSKTIAKSYLNNIKP